MAAISPAIWTSYEQAQAVNPGAYASAADFAADDAVTHTAALSGTPVRVASGNDDPFHPGVLALAQQPAEDFDGRAVAGMPHGPVLQRAGAAVTPIPRPPPNRLRTAANGGRIWSGNTPLSK